MLFPCPVCIASKLHCTVEALAIGTLELHRVVKSPATAGSSSFFKRDLPAGCRSLLSLISSLVPPHGSSHALHSSQLSAGSNCTVTCLKLPQTSVPFCPPSVPEGAAVCTISSRRAEQFHRAQVQLTFNSSPKFYCPLFMTNPTREVCLFILYLCLSQFHSYLPATPRSWVWQAECEFWRF